jgi:hypothetical protein
MTKIEIDGADLVVRMTGMDQLLSLKSELRIPLAHVAGVERDTEEAATWYHGVRFPGTNIPGVIVAGTFYAHEGRVFWDVHHANAIAIRLHDERYVKLVVEVERPDATIAMIEAARDPHALDADPDL